MIEEWNEIFVTEIKNIGEKFQRHNCKEVCFKNRPTRTCRFNFPREEIQASYYDEKLQAIVFVCRDGTVNNYNPYILVYSRHNHDLSCILSGQAAKSAMIYITDYITKMDVKTYQVLSVL
ncbi:hypothetical protein SCHPADRAFT_831859, partial [Schizopora paradoxa]